MHGYTLNLKKTMAQPKVLEIPCRSTPTAGERRVTGSNANVADGGVRKDIRSDKIRPIICPWPLVVRKNSIRLPSDRDVGSYLFGLRDLDKHPMKSSGVYVLSCSAFRGSDRFTATVSIRQRQVENLEIEGRLRSIYGYHN